MSTLLHNNKEKRNGVEQRSHKIAHNLTTDVQATRASSIQHTTGREWQREGVLLGTADTRFAVREGRFNPGFAAYLSCHYGQVLYTQ